ncbi:MAG: DUF4974 domain-containing protein [Butyricimonas paravirosa]
MKSTGAESILHRTRWPSLIGKGRSRGIGRIRTTTRLGGREFVFQNETIEEIMDRLCRWYDTEVFMRMTRERKRFTGLCSFHECGRRVASDWGDGDGTV